MTSYWRIPISLTLRAPWVTPGDAAPGPSTDIVLARNQEGQFILPSSLVKGNLRAAADTLVDEGAVGANVRDACFGTESGTRAKGVPVHPWRVANEPERGAIIFGDLEADREAQDKDGRTQRVKIDSDLGAAREGHLLFVECPFPFGTEVTFKGEVILWGNMGVSEGDAVLLLKQSLGRIFAIGGMKSVGFGRVENFQVEAPVAVVAATARAPALSLEMAYNIDRPFIVDATRHSGNLSVGSDIIAGSAIKALLARGCAAANMDSDAYLAALNISHAAPADRKTLPLSLSVADNQVFCNLDGKIRPGFHTFQGDWKNSENDVRTALGDGWDAPDLHYSGRSRTAIDSKSMTSLFEQNTDDSEGVGQLFSQMAVAPNGLIWRGTISAPDDMDMMGQMLGLLDAGLPGLGKTGAVLTGSGQPHAAPVTPTTETLNLTLTSDACLFKPQDAINTNMGDLYRAYFKAQGFNLINFFAQQVLKGGYLALRYPATDGEYIPWVLTEAGSVFRLESNGSANITDILANGLPPADGLSGDWQKFPFLRENGFGRVVHDILDHNKLAGGLKL